MRVISALRQAPEFVHGFVKDLRVRWALEEAGLDYAVQLVEAGQGIDSPYRSWQPFGQVPAYRDDTVSLFESGAILHYLGCQSTVLMPEDAASRARVTAWLFAAGTTVQPLVDRWNDYRGVLDETAYGELERRLFARLESVQQALGTQAFLTGEFSVADLLMSAVLREVASEGGLGAWPQLERYHNSLEARPAFRRALNAHLNDIRGGSDD